MKNGIEKLFDEMKSEVKLPSGVDHTHRVIKQLVDENDRLNLEMDKSPAIFNDKKLKDSVLGMNKFIGFINLYTNEFNDPNNKSNLVYRTSDYLLNICRTSLNFETGSKALEVKNYQKEYLEYHKAIGKCRKFVFISKNIVALFVLFFIVLMLNKNEMLTLNIFNFLYGSFVPSDFFWGSIIFLILIFLKFGRMQKLDDDFAFLVIRNLEVARVMQDVFYDIAKSQVNFNDSLSTISTKTPISLSHKINNEDIFISMKVKGVYYFNEEKELTLIEEGINGSLVDNEDKFLLIDLIEDYSKEFIPVEQIKESLEELSENKLKDGYLFKANDERIYLNNILKYNFFNEILFSNIFLNIKGDSLFLFLKEDS